MIDNPASKKRVPASTTDRKLLGPLSRKLQRAIDNKKYLHQGVTLASMSHDLVTNRTYLSDLVHMEYGMSFPEYINYLRIEEAKRILEQPEPIAICELYKQLGYATISPFYRNFKRLVGCTAFAYRQKFYPEETRW